MLSKTLIFLLALSLFAFHAYTNFYESLWDRAPFTEKEKAKLEASIREEAEGSTEYSFSPNGKMMIKTAIFEIPNDRLTFQFYGECTAEKWIDHELKTRIKVKEASIYPVLRIEFGEILKRHQGTRLERTAAN